MFCVFRSILQELEVAPEGSGKPHGGVVKTEYLQDPKGRNLKTWPHHMDDTLVIGS